MSWDYFRHIVASKVAIPLIEPPTGDGVVEGWFIDTPVVLTDDDSVVKMMIYFYDGKQLGIIFAGPEFAQQLTALHEVHWRGFAETKFCIREKDGVYVFDVIAKEWVTPVVNKILRPNLREMLSRFEKCTPRWGRAHRICPDCGDLDCAFSGLGKLMHRVLLKGRVT